MIQIDLKGFSKSSGTTSHTPSAARDHLLGRFMNKMGNSISRSAISWDQQCHTCDITSKNSRTTRRHDDLIQEIYWYWFSLLQLWRFLEAALLPLEISFRGRRIILHVLRRIVLFLPHCHFLDAIQYKRLISLCDENRVSDWKLYPCYNLATNIGSHSNNCRRLHNFLRSDNSCGGGALWLY